MRKGLYVIGLAVLLMAISASVQKPAAPEYVEGQVLVKFKETVNAEAVSATMATVGIQSLKFIEKIGVYQTSITSNKSVQEVVSDLAAHADVLYAEPNYIYTIEVAPNDPQFDQLWGLNNTGQTGGTAGADISAPDAWDVSTGSSQVLVGVVDTGIDYTHQDLAANIFTNPGEDAWSNPNDPSTGDGADNDGNGKVDDWKGWNFVSNNNNPYDDNLHGTHVSGTIGAIGNNNVGVAGVNWTVRMLPLKFLDSRGSGNTTDAVDAIIYGADMGVHILSNSWGGGGFSQSLQNAIQYANDRGVLFVAAAGNDGTDNDALPHYPSNYTVPNIVAVAASDHSDNRALWGSGGGGDGCGFTCSNAMAATPGSNYGQTTVDIAAPGKDIYSTVPGNSYSTLSGTSMATPHVAGAAALLLAVNPNLTIAQLESALYTTVDLLPDFTDRLVTEGRLNLAAALASVTPAP